MTIASQVADVLQDHDNNEELLRQIAANQQMIESQRKTIQEQVEQENKLRENLAKQKELIRKMSVKIEELKKEGIEKDLEIAKMQAACEDWVNKIIDACPFKKRADVSVFFTFN